MDLYLEKLHVEVHDLKEPAPPALRPQLRVGHCLIAAFILVKEVVGQFLAVQESAGSSPPSLGQVLEQSWQQQQRLALGDR